jgi:hypothetical protein
MDEKPVNPESRPQLAKRCFVLCLGIALACGVLAALNWQATLPAGFPGGPMLLLLSIFLTVVADVSFVIALVALWLSIRKRGMLPTNHFSIQAIVALIATPIILVIVGAMAAGVIGTLWSRTHARTRGAVVQPLGVADQRVVDQSMANQSMAAVEQFLRNLPRYVGGFTYYNSHGDPMRTPEGQRGRDQARAELDWGNFRRRFGDFISWSQTDSSTGQADVQRTELFDSHYLGFKRDAQFEKGTAKLEIIVQRGTTPTGRPEIVGIDVAPSQSSGTSTRIWVLYQ